MIPSTLQFVIDGAASATGDLNHQNTDSAIDLDMPAQIPANGRSPVLD
jgi:hypothetical protein